MDFMDLLGPFATPDEIDAAAFFLGSIRARNTYEALRWKGNAASRTAATIDAHARRVQYYSELGSKISRTPRVRAKP